MKILIGSKALQKYPGFEDRKAKDIDYFSDKKIDGSEVFYHNDLELYNPWKNNENISASLNELYTIKISHIFWDINWAKHSYDILNMQTNGAEVIPELFDILYKIWEEKHGPKKAKLNVMAEDFFKNTITRIYDHDSIHASVAYYDEPLFNKILADGEQVKVDQNKFDNMSFEDKLKLVREEVYATALERLVIPSDYTHSPRGAYLWALKKTITSFSKGWFPYFIVTNLVELWSPDINYVAEHLNNKERLIKL